MKAKHLVLLLFTFIQSQRLLAQDHSPVGVMISHGHPKGGWMVSYSFMQMQMKGNRSGTDAIADENVFSQYLMSPQSMHMDMHMIMVMYGLSGRLSFMAMAAYQKSEMKMIMLPGVMHMHHGMEMSSTSGDMDMSSSGIGDTRIWGIYKLMNAESSSLVFSLGVNLPTGSIDLDGKPPMYEGLRMPYMMQLGSGSVDFLPGITYLKNHKKISWSVQGLSVLRLMDNANSYHYGNEFVVNAWTSYKFGSLFSTSLRAEAVNSDKISGADKQIYYAMEPDADPKNYGGTRVNAYLGGNFYLSKGILSDTKIGFEFGAPVFQDVNGIQLGTSYCWTAGITKSF